MDHRRNVSRRAAVLAAAGAALSLGCSSQSTADRLDAAQEEAIAQVDASSDRLPLGSVVRALGATWMIAGQGTSCAALGDDSGVFDYYAVKWPAGIEEAFAETAYSALLNKEDVSELLFIGLVNDEDGDMREYAEAHRSADGSTAGTAIVEYSNGLYDGKLRLRGYRSEELYGEEYGQGILFDPEALAEALGDGEEG